MDAQLLPAALERDGQEFVQNGLDVNGAELRALGHCLQQRAEPHVPRQRVGHGFKEANLLACRGRLAYRCSTAAFQTRRFRGMGFRTPAFQTRRFCGMVFRHPAFQTRLAFFASMAPVAGVQRMSGH